MFNNNYIKIPNQLITLAQNKQYNQILNTYIYILFNINQNRTLYTNIELLSNSIEYTYDKRYNKIDSYNKMINILNDDIIFNDNIILSKVISLEYFTYNQKIPQNKQTMKISMEYENNEILSNYTRFYYIEYETLNYIFEEYYKNNNKRLNKSYLINLYTYLKMLINIKNNINKELDISIKYLAKKTNISEKTIESYLKIMENFNIIKIKRGDYTNQIANNYEIILDKDKNIL